MFTGIILGKGTVVEKRSSGSGMIFSLESDFDLTDPEEGESIAVNGVCLTAKNISTRKFTVDVSPESLARTNLGKLSVGSKVNLERALRLSDRLGGHMVSGHVDAVSQVLERRPLGDFVQFTFGIPAGLSKYIIEKGSIGIDGTSLTVNSCDDKTFTIVIIPHTLDVTLMGTLREGDTVNIEVDLIGKYVEKMLQAEQDDPEKQQGGINPEFLAKHGFIK
ncbi:MAG: riboflavin synthase [Deltaproteobacteria bacterium]|jgi:riboflavin synthase|nr:MAG: riboflavin synthase [Deltaproteobacteria bacterium]